MLRRLFKLSSTFGKLARFSLSKVNPAHAKILRQPVIRAIRLPGILKTARRFPLRLGPQFWRSVVNASRVQARAAGVIGSWARYGGHIGASFAFAGLTLNTSDSFRASSSVFDKIRNMFDQKYKFGRTKDEYPNCIDGYDVGNALGRGCNAVVYEARVRQNVDCNEQDVGPIREIFPSTSGQGNTAEAVNRPYPLAIKMCYNLNGSFGSSVDQIVSNMGQELVPCTAAHVKRMLRREKTVSRKHPNIVEVYTAFVDEIRMSRPASRPPGTTALADLNFELDNLSSTLFLVMKRYKTTLFQYILTEEYNIRKALVMYAQILEGVRFLVDEGVAHRDLKSNNILLEYNSPGDVPSVVISDFGCCLANQVLTLFYWDDNTDLGGNRALRPPEIACAKPGLTSVLNFSRSDLWAAATIGYEIFTRVNPFYRSLQSETYHKDDLPQLPSNVPYSVRKLTKRMLCRNPQTRPSPTCCANVLALSLFDLNVFREVIGARKLPNYIRFSDGYSECGANTKKAPIQIQNGTLDEGLLHEAVDPFADESPVDKLKSPTLWQALAEALCYYSAETMIGGVCKTLSRPEVVLRTEFLRRVDMNSVLEAAEYFLL